jgi:RND superfamily putative drug exporter
MVGDMSIVTARYGQHRDSHRIVRADHPAGDLRRPVTVLLPLITIGISVTSAQGVVSGLAQLGLGCLR